MTAMIASHQHSCVRTARNVCSFPGKILLMLLLLTERKEKSMLAVLLTARLPSLIMRLCTSLVRGNWGWEDRLGRINRQT